MAADAVEGGDKRARAHMVLETDQERGSRFRKLFRRVMGDRKACDIRE